MDLSSFLRAVVTTCVPLAFTPLALAAQEAEPPKGDLQRGGLQRVDPQPEHRDDSRDLARAFKKDFERSEWLERLSVPDLDQRERNLDLLLKRARLDPLARAFLEQLASDPKGGELTWTARLALRQLGPVNFPLPLGVLGADPFGAAVRMQQQMEKMLSQGARAFQVAPKANREAANSRASSRWVRIQQDAQGVRVTLTDVVDGKEQPRTYTGTSLEELERLNPELERALGGLHVQADAGSNLDLRFDLGSTNLDPFLRQFLGLGQPLVPQARSRPIIGNRLGVIVETLDATRAKERGLEAGQGLLVERTYPETYAQLLGVGAGSVLLEIDGVMLAKPDDIERAMQARDQDDPLHLVWLDELSQRHEKTWVPAETR